MASFSEGSKKSSDKNDNDYASSGSDTEVRKVDEQATRAAKQQPASF